MKQFSLEEYLKNPSMKVVTRNGDAVKIQCINFDDDEYPIIARVAGTSFSTPFTKDGKFIKSNKDTKYDLFFAPEKEKHEGWVNVYKEFESNTNYMGRICNSEEEAKKKTDINGIYLATVKIEWEE